MSRKAINNIFRQAAQSGAQDLVVSSRAGKLVLDYYFPDGTKRRFSLPQKAQQELLIGLRQILDIRPDELITKKPVHLASPRGRLDFHVTIMPDENQEKIIINVLDRNQRNWRLSQLGWQDGQKKEIEDFLKRGSGLILVSSPTGHGKSATAFAIASRASSEDKETYALEDFPETTLDGINSLKQTTNNWQRVLSHDSEIIVADSLDQEKNLENAFRAASSGRLVIGTISADSSFEVLAKVLKIQLPLKLKLNNLKLITNQRLTSLNPSLWHVKNNIRNLIGIFEVLKITPRLRTLITNGGDLANKKFWEGLINEAMTEGYKPLEFDRRKKIRHRIIK